MYACVADASRGKAGRLYRSQDTGQNVAAVRPLESKCAAR